MKCDKCKNDFSYWTELVNISVNIKGFKNIPVKIKRLVCKDCLKFYESIKA